MGGGDASAATAADVAAVAMSRGEILTMSLGLSGRRR